MSVTIEDEKTPSGAAPHGDVPDIHDVEPVSERDHACLAEVRDVLKRHGQLDRLGIALLHSHFEVRPDEMLVEETDVEGRVLTIRPVRKAEAGNTIQTIWKLGADENVPLLGCQQYCGKNIHGNHGSFHKQTRTEDRPPTLSRA